MTLKHNGKVYYFDRIGALADIADWISLDSVFLDTKEILNGQQTLGGYLQKMDKFIKTSPSPHLVNTFSKMSSKWRGVISKF